MYKNNVTPRIAFMIMAHQHPNQLKRLIGRLQAPWSDIYVHVDGKLDQSPFLKALENYNVNFVPDSARLKIQWASLSQILAQLTLIRMVKPDTDRFCLLSGADYPAVPLQVISKAFATESEFIRIDRELDPNGHELHDSFISRPYINFIPFFNPRDGIFPFYQPLVQRMITRILQLIKRRPLNELKLYHGSGWWALSNEAITTILNYCDQHPSFVNWFKYSNSPDEIIFHSLIKAGPFARNIIDDREKYLDSNIHPNLHGCHYIDWDYQGPGGLPKILDLSDISSIKSSKALFVRKVHPEISRSLLDTLDAEVDQSTFFSKKPYQ